MLWGVYILKMKSFKAGNFTKANDTLPYFEHGGMYNPFDDVDNCYILTHGDSPMDPGTRDVNPLHVGLIQGDISKYSGTPILLT